VTRGLRYACVVLALTAAGCGSSKSTTTAATTAATPAATTGPVATTAAPAATAAAPAATAAAPVTTTAVPAATTAAPAGTTAAPPKASSAAGPQCTGLPSAGAADSSIDVSLVEWSIKGPASVKGGNVGINVTNTGGNAHELVIIKGDSFASLPKLANGAVDEAKLEPGALVGKTEKLNGSKNCSTTVALAAGKYVMVCNIQFGAISHAAKGQVLDFEVTA
jgi:hypothetical protein